ncbi:Coiled-coil domain-containing protein 48, partial [Bos mutus]
DSRGAGRLPRADFRALCAVLGLRFEGAAAPGEASGDTAAGDTNSGDVISGDAAAGEAAEWDEDAEEEARLALRAEPPERSWGRRQIWQLCRTQGGSIHWQPGAGSCQDRRENSGTSGPCQAVSEAGPGARAGRRLQQEEDVRGGSGWQRTSLEARCLCSNVTMARLAHVTREGAYGCRRTPWRGASHAGREGQLLVKRNTPCFSAAVSRLLENCRACPGNQRSPRPLNTCVSPPPHRSEGTQLPGPSRASPEPDTKSSEPEDGEARGPEPPPEGAWGSGNSPASRPPGPGLDEQLFRSVEGQAASDEEDDREKWQEAQRLPAEVTALLAGLSGCGSGCDDQTAKKLMTYCSHLGGANHAHALGELETCVAMLVEQLGSRGCGAKTLRTPEEEAELQRKVGENESLRQELQMVETERVRLSLLEEKLEDVLGLLQRLRDLNISKKALGKILLSTLDACRDPAHDGPSGPLAVLEALRRALAGCELLRREPSAPASTAPALTHSFPISG